MNRFVMVLSLAVVVSFMAGCSPVHSVNLASERRFITIETIPPGATVYELNYENVPARRLGTTPMVNTPVTVVTNITRKQNMPQSKLAEINRRIGCVTVRIEKSGYQPYIGILNTERGRTVVHKIKLIRD